MSARGQDAVFPAVRQHAESPQGQEGVQVGHQGKAHGQPQKQRPVEEIGIEEEGKVHRQNGDRQRACRQGQAQDHQQKGGLDRLDGGGGIAALQGEGHQERHGQQNAQGAQKDGVKPAETAAHGLGGVAAHKDEGRGGKDAPQQGALLEIPAESLPEPLAHHEVLLVLGQGQDHRLQRREGGPQRDHRQGKQDDSRLANTRSASLFSAAISGPSTSNSFIAVVSPQIRP